LIIPDVLKSKDSAIQKIHKIPSGIEEINDGFCNDKVVENENKIECVNKISIYRNNFNRRVINTFVNNNRRSCNAIKQEIDLSFRNALCQRKSVEENETTSNIIKLCSANSRKEIIEADCFLVDYIFGIPTTFFLII